MPISITLKADSRHGKYGIVVVNNSDGTFNREFRITDKELADLQASANGVPPGVTKAEWQSGRVIVVGKDFDVGDIEQTRDKQQRDVYRAKIAEKIDLVTGRLTEDWLVVPVADASGVFPTISVAQDKLAGSIVSVDSGIITVADGIISKN